MTPQRKIAPGAPPLAHVQNFARLRNNWLRAVAREGSLSSAAKSLAIHLALDLMNEEHGGAAWASVEAMAAGIRASDRWTRTAIRQLEAGGFLRATPRPRATTLLTMAPPSEWKVKNMALENDPTCDKRASKKQHVSSAEGGSMNPPFKAEGSFRHEDEALSAPMAEGSCHLRGNDPSAESVLGNRSRDYLPPVDNHLLDRDGDDEQPEPTIPLMVAAMRRLADEPVLDEPSLSGKIAAASTKGLPEASVETSPDPASMATTAERAEARKRLLARLAALDAAEPTEPDSTSATADCPENGDGCACETDRSATGGAERDENAPAASAGDFLERTAANAGADGVADAEFREIAPDPAIVADPAIIADSPAAPGFGSNLFGELDKPSKSGKITAAQIAEAFARFWAVFPKKAGKRDAQLAFEAAVKKGVDPEHIIASAARYGEAVKAADTESRFVKWPQGWIRGQRYDDDPSTLPQPRNSGSAPRGYERGPTSMQNFERGRARILEQAEAAERAKRAEQLAQAEAYCNAKPF